MEYWVHILTNISHKVLHIGVTNHFARRFYEHHGGLVNGFTKRYKLHKLLYAESTGNIAKAIAREKQLQGWLRFRKIQLIESINPEWKDLGVAWNLFGHPERSEGSQSTRIDASLRSA